MPPDREGTCCTDIKYVNKKDQYNYTHPLKKYEGEILYSANKSMSKIIVGNNSSSESNSDLQSSEDESTAARKPQKKSDRFFRHNYSLGTVEFLRQRNKLS